MSSDEEEFFLATGHSSLTTYVMILAIDIGNTTTSFGVFEKGRLKSQFAIATQSFDSAFGLAHLVPSPSPLARDSTLSEREGPSTALGARQDRGERAKRVEPPNRTADEITLQLKALAKTRRLHLRRAKQIILCSVVPRMSAVLIQALNSLAAEPDRKGGRSPERSRGIPIKVVGQDVSVPLINRYTYPEQVGQDRLVGAYAAWRRFKQDCIVADFGTAITIDVVTKQGEYLGGLIAPGLEISLEALATRTALLPKVELREPPELLGRDTAHSIRSGLIHGYAALCDGLVAQLKASYAPGATVVATGGASPLVAKYAHSLTYLRPHLVLEGLHLLTRAPHPSRRRR